MAPDTTAIDDRISEIKAAIREGRIAFWLCVAGLLAGLLVVPPIEAALIYMAVTSTADEASSWAPLAVVGGLGGLLALGFLLDTGISRRESVITNRRALRRSEEERKVVLAGKGPSRLVVLNRYKNDLPEIVEGFRVTAKRYRRQHGVLQLVVVVGSLGASAIIGLLGSDTVGRSIAAGISAAVAIAAAYSGYFRYKEKSLSLQSNADSIEQEHRAVQLGIGSYSGLPALEALTVFAEKVEALRSNQQRQALELDQAVQVEYQSGPSYDLQ